MTRRRHVLAAVSTTLLALAAAAPAATAGTAAAVPSRAGTAVWVTQDKLGIQGESVRPQAIAATSGGDVWMVGYVYTGIEFRTLAERRHDGTWTLVDTPDVETAPAQDFLEGVDAVAPDDVWMVGSSAVSSSNLADKPLVEHWDGTSVSIVPVPDPAHGTGASLEGVAGSADDLWAVGTTRDAATTNVALAMHWDGSMWKRVPFEVDVPGCGHARESALTSVVDLGGGRVYAGGSCDTPTRQIGFVEHLVAGRWEPSATVPAAGVINSLAVGPDGTVWASGTQQSTDGGVGWSRGVALRGSGSRFVAVDQPVPKAGVYDGFAGIVATGSSVLAVGSGTSEQPPFTGFGAFALNGARWTPEAVRDSFDGFGAFYAVTVDSAGHVLATGFGIAAAGDDVGIVSVRRQ